MAAPEIVTFGCRLNAFESEVMRGHARAAGLEDLVVVHTCAVTAEAERQARQAIRRARRGCPHARVVVTGCSAQVAAGTYAAMPEVDHVVGNDEKLRWATWAGLAGTERVAVADIMTARRTAGHLVDGIEGRSRAFLQVQQGCDHRCTFCIIPYGRGPCRSLSLAQIAGQARRFLEGGYRELVLTGVDITSYGCDLDGRPTLGAMVKRLLREVPAIERLRLSSLDPAALDPELEELIADEPRLMPHLHLSVQAGDDLVLKRMRRRHDRAQVVSLTRRLRRRRPDIAFGADLIAGFPTETEAMFLRSLELVDDAGLTFLHVFPYSPRAGTPAARMPQVPVAVRKERAARLRAKGALRLEAFLRHEIGQERQVLVEHGGRGHTEHFAAFRFAGESPGEGTVVRVRVEGIDAGGLLGMAA